MDRIVRKSKSFAEAEAWEREQYRRMSPQERMRAARQIRERMFPGKQPDIREWHSNQKPR